MQKINIILLFTLVFLSSSCTTIIKEPHISISRIQLDRLSFKESEASFTLNVSNPNNFAIYLSGIEYNLSLNGVNVANGENLSRITIAAGAEKTVAIPVRLHVSKLFNVIPNLWRDKQIKYDLSGKLKTPLINIPFHRTGGINVTQ